MFFSTKPYNLAFCGNPIRYSVNITEGGGGTSIDYSVNTITLTDIDTTENHAIDVTLLCENVTFTLKAVPDGPTDIPAAETGMSVLAWATIIFERLQQNANLMRNYAITFDTDLIVITLTAYEAGEFYDISVGESTITGFTMATPIGGDVGTPGADGVVLWVLDKNNILIGEDYKPLNSTNYVNFNIAEYLEVALSAITHPLFHLTPGSQLIYQFNPDFIFKYKVGAAFRTAGVIGTMIYDSWHYAATGGLNRLALNYWNTISGGFWANNANRNRFMTWLPSIKKTFQESPELLYFAIQNLTLTKVVLNVAYLCTDNTQGSFQPYELTTSAQYQVIECACGFNALGLDTIEPGKQVQYWTVWLTNNNGTVISEARAFDINFNYYEFKRNFVFKNSYGVFETVTFIGKGDAKEDYERENVSYNTDELENYSNVPDRHSSILKRQSFKVNTGWITKAIYDYMSEFLGSLEIYEIVSDVPARIRITSKTTKPARQDDDYNHFLEIEYERAWQDRFYSKL